MDQGEYPPFWPSPDAGESSSDSPTLTHNLLTTPDFGMPMFPSTPFTSSFELHGPADPSDHLNSMADYSVSIQQEPLRATDSAPATAGKSRKRRSADNNENERKRLSQACGNCRKKKVKCSGHRPVCSKCLQLGLQCTYAPSSRARFPRRGYKEMLQNRLDKMEKLLEPLKQDGYRGEVWKNVPDYQEDDVFSEVEGEDDDFESRIKNWPASDGRSTNLLPSAIAKKTDNETVTLSPPILSDGGHKYLEADPSIQTYYGSIESTTAPTEPFLYVKPTSYTTPSPEIKWLISPEPEIIEHLSECYFSHVYNSYAFLHKPSFMLEIRSRTAAPALVLAICAIAARFSQHPSLKTQHQSQAGDHFAARSRELIAAEFDKPTLSNVQTCLILALHEFGSGRGARAWMYGGIAMRMAVSLGLNVEVSATDSDQEFSFIEQEVRRRTFWSCFVMDRFASSASSTAPQFLREDDVHIQLPASEQEFTFGIPVRTEFLDGSQSFQNGIEAAAKGTLDVYAYLIKAVAIWGRVITFVNRPRADLKRYVPWSPGSDFLKLDDDLYTLHSKLPANLKYTRNNFSGVIAENQSPLFILLHICIRHSLFLLHRCLFPNSSRAILERAPANFINQCVRKCLASANAISTIIADVLEMNTAILIPFMGHAAFTTAILHISNAFSPDLEISGTAKRHLATSLKMLMLMRGHWTLTERWCQAVRELYELQQSSASDKSYKSRNLLTQRAVGETASAKYPAYGVWEDELPDSVPMHMSQRRLYVDNAKKTLHQSNQSQSTAEKSDLAAPNAAETFNGPVSLANPTETLMSAFIPNSDATADLAIRNQLEYDKIMFDALKASASLPVSPTLENFGGTNIRFNEFDSFPLFDLNEAIPDLEKIISTLGPEITDQLSNFDLDHALGLVA